MKKSYYFFSYPTKLYKPVICNDGCVCDPGIDGSVKKIGDLLSSQFYYIDKTLVTTLFFFQNQVMNEHQIHIAEEAKKVVTDIFKTKVNPLFVFHNLAHTRQVVKAAEEIERYYQLNDDDQFVLFISAWFHDTGFSDGHAEGHEKESIKLAAAFLNHQYAEQKIILRISSCIQATHIPQQPLTLVEKIMCDADLYHLGTNIFSNWNDGLRKELQNYYKSDISNEEWRQNNIEFLKSHKFFTGYCQQKLEPIKQRWIKQLQNKQGTMA